MNSSLSFCTLIALILLGCTPTKPATGPAATSAVTGAAGSPFQDRVELPDPALPIAVVELEGVARNALVKALTSPNLPGLAAAVEQLHVTFLDDDAFFARAAPAVEAYLGAETYKANREYMDREWVAIPVAGEILARKQVKGPDWSKGHAISGLATAFACAVLPMGKGNPDHDVQTRWGTAAWLGEAAMHIAEGRAVHRSLLFATPVSPPHLEVSGAPATFGYDLDAGTIPALLVARGWRHFAAAAAGGMYTRGGFNLLLRWLASPPSNASQLTAMNPYAFQLSDAHFFSRPDRRSEWEVTEHGPLYGLLFLGPAAYSYMPTLRGAAVLSDKGVELTALVMDGDGSAIKKGLEAGKARFVERDLGDGYSLLVYGFGEAEGARLEGALEGLDARVDVGTPRWTRSLRVPVRSNAEQVCAFRTRGQTKRVSDCLTEVIPFQEGNLFFESQTPPTSAASVARTFGLADRLERADSPSTVSRQEDPPMLRMRRHTPPGVDGRDGLLLSLPICNGHASLSLVATAPVLESTKFFGMEKSFPKSPTETFCEKLAYEDAHDLPEPQIPPGLLP